MVGFRVPLDDVDFESLNEFLMSDRSPADCMMISDLDGFLTGVAIGPELIMPSEWLPVVWGSDDPVFEDAHEAQSVLGAIMSRFNEIIHGIDAGVVEPYFWVGPEDQVIAADWAEGFFDAIKLRPEAWKELKDSEDDRVHLVPILALCRDEHGQGLFDTDKETAEETARLAADAIPRCVLAIAAFWRARRRARPGGLRTEAFGVGTRAGPKVGRNDPCPCGSGKKFKKCCSSDA